HGSKTGQADFILLLAKLPRLVFYDVLVYRTHERPHVLQRARKLKARIQLIRALDDFSCKLRDRVIAGATRGFRRGIGNLLAEVARDHRKRSARKISEIVRQIRVIALHEGVEGETAVLAKNYFPKQEITQRIVAEHVDHSFGAHDIAARLRHLVLLEQQPSMYYDLFWQR